MFRIASIAALSLAALPALANANAPCARHAIKPAPLVRIKAPRSVLRGDPHSFRRIATLDRRAVFAEIPAYQTLTREKLTKRDPRYHFLLRQANEAFDHAIRSLCRTHGIDLVVARGDVEVRGLDVLDLTDPLRQEVAPRPRR